MFATHHAVLPKSALGKVQSLWVSEKPCAWRVAGALREARWREEEQLDCRSFMTCSAILIIITACGALGPAKQQVAGADGFSGAPNFLDDII